MGQWWRWDSDGGGTVVEVGGWVGIGEERKWGQWGAWVGIGIGKERG